MNFSFFNIFFLIQVICAVILISTAQIQDGPISESSQSHPSPKSGHGLLLQMARQRRGILKGAAVGALAGGAIGGITKHGK